MGWRDDPIIEAAPAERQEAARRGGPGAYVPGQYPPSKEPPPPEPAAPPTANAGGERGTAPWENDPKVGPDSPDATFLNRGLATTLGAPVDLVNAVTRPVTEPLGLYSDRPIGGSGSIEAGFRWLEDQGLGQFVPKEGEVADEMGEYIFRGIGETAGALLPGTKAAQMAAQSAADHQLTAIGAEVHDLDIAMGKRQDSEHFARRRIEYEYLTQTRHCQ